MKTATPSFNWTQERDEIVVNSIKEGLNGAQICERVGCTLKQLYTLSFKNKGININNNC